MSHLIIVRDPIHNYISLSQLERLLIDDPLFQRLRYVSQNGMAHLVYPSNRTSRFIHSLGAMHLSGQFLIRGIANTSRADADSFWGQVSVFVRHEMRELSTNEHNLLRYIREADDPFYREAGLDTAASRDTDKIVLLQGLRLAAVMHDLGHLPFSHTVEHVLSAVLRTQRVTDSADRKSFQSSIATLLDRAGVSRHSSFALHEAIGQELMSAIFSGVDWTNHSVFALLCFRVAKAIARHSNTASDPYGVLGALHSVVSGELDADRCDYVRRDGQAAGFEFGDFDLQRILGTVRFVQTSSGTFHLLPTTVATNALESFLLERYRVYKWLVFHPMVVRVDLALSRSLTILLEVWFNEVTGPDADDVRKLLSQHDFSRLWKPFASEQSYRYYVGCDENWLMALFRETQRLLAFRKRSPELRILALKAYLDLVCDRQKGHLRPLWKRQEEYQRFAILAAAELAKGPLSAQTLRDNGEPEIAWCNRVCAALLDAAASTSSPITAMRDFEARIQATLVAKGWKQGGIVATRLRFTPYRTVYVTEVSKDESATGSQQPVPLENLSTIVSSLNGMWNQEMQFRPYWFARRHTNGEYELSESSEAAGPPIEMFAQAFALALSSMAESENKRAAHSGGPDQRPEIETTQA